VTMVGAVRTITRVAVGGVQTRFRTGAKVVRVSERLAGMILEIRRGAKRLIPTRS